MLEVADPAGWEGVVVPGDGRAEGLMLVIDDVEGQVHVGRAVPDVQHPVREEVLLLGQLAG